MSYKTARIISAICGFYIFILYSVGKFFVEIHIVYFIKFIRIFCKNHKIIKSKNYNRDETSVAILF